MRSIFGADPGLHVGLLHYRFDTGVVEMVTLPPLEAADWVERRLTSGDIIGCERFTQGRQAKTNQNDALEVTGMLRYLAHRKLASLVVQGAAEATKVAPTPVLRALGMWRRGDPDHVRRAAAQAAYVLFRLRPDEFERRTGPGTVV